MERGLFDLDFDLSESEDLFDLLCPVGRTLEFLLLLPSPLLFLFAPSLLLPASSCTPYTVWVPDSRLSRPDI